MFNITRFLAGIFGKQYKPHRRPTIEIPVESNSTVKAAWDTVSRISSKLDEDLVSARRQATLALESMVRRSEFERRRLEIIFDNLNDSILILSKDGDIQTANRTARVLFESPTSALKEFNLMQILTSEGLEYCSLSRESAAYAEYVESLQRVEPESFNYAYSEYLRTKTKLLNKPIRFTYSGNVTRCLEAVINVLTLDPTSEDFCYIAVIRDLTPSIEIEKHIHRLQDLNQHLLESSPVPVFHKDVNLNFTRINQPLKDLLGLTDVEILGKTASDIFTQQCAKHLDDLDARALKSPDVIAANVLLKTLTLEHNARVYSKALRSGQDISGLSGVIVVDSKFDAKTRSLIFASASKAIVFFDNSMCVVGCNDEFVRLVGLSKGDIIGHSSTESPISLYARPTVTDFIFDDVHVAGKNLSRLCVPVLTEGVDCGMIYIYFVHFE